MVVFRKKWSSFSSLEMIVLDKKLTCVYTCVYINQRPRICYLHLFKLHGTIYLTICRQLCFVPCTFETDWELYFHSIKFIIILIILFYLLFLTLNTNWLVMHILLIISAHNWVYFLLKIFVSCFWSKFCVLRFSSLPYTEKGAH